MGFVSSTSPGVTRLDQALSIEGVPHISTVPSSSAAESGSDKERDRKREGDFVELSEEARHRKPTGEADS